MNQIAIGKFIAQKRKEQNLTQEQLAQLMNVEDDEKSIHTYDNEQVLEIISEMQDLKNTKTIIIGFLLIIMGSVMLALSHIFGGTTIQDFLSGLMLGFSIAEMLIGVFLLGRWLAYKDKQNMS